MKDLIINHDEIMKFWNSNKNKEFDLKSIGIGSHVSYYWKCPICNHEWKTRVNHLINDTKGCPNCKKIKKQTIHASEVGLICDEKELMKEWDYSANKAEGLDPTKLSKKSNKKANWICLKEKHKWKSTIYNRVVHVRNCPYCSNQKILEGYNDLATVDPKLALEWNYEKNDVKPTMVGVGARKKYWWKCEKGHEWMASLSNRHRLNVGCPYCSQSVSFPEKAIYFYIKKYIKNIIPNYRSKIINNKELDIYLPESKIGIEYDGLAFHNQKKDKEKDIICQKNGIKIIHVAEKSKTLFKICNNYIFYNPQNRKDLNTIINYLLNLLLKTKDKDYGIDIEKDSNKIYKIIEKNKNEKSLFNTNPELKDIWNYEKNEGLNPNMFSKGSGLAVWWKCEKGHEWKASIYNVAKGSRCPYCSNRIAIINENDIFSTSNIYKKLWNYEKNINIHPNSIKPNSNIKVWWKCERGHEWEATPASITRGSRCPYCRGNKVLKGFNDLFTTHPHLEKEWDYEKNKISPYEISAGSGKKAWWKCEKGHEWESTISNRTSLNRGCPICGRVRAWETRKKDKK